MIILKAHVEIPNKNPEKMSFLASPRRPKIIQRWKNDFEFDFNILKAEEWRKFLRNDYRFPNGKKLPVVEDGYAIIYTVEMFGLSKEFYELGRDIHPPRGGFLNLFPSYDKNKKIRDLRTYATLMTVNELAAMGKIKR